MFILIKFIEENYISFWRLIALYQFFAGCCFISNCFAYEFPPLLGREKKVGTIQFFWHDINRQEYYSKGNKKCRELSVQCWYPGEITESFSIDSLFKKKYKKPYLGSVLPYLLKMARESYGVPEFLLNRVFSDVYTHAEEKISLSKKKAKYPVIIFSHGLGSLNTLQTVYAENLASNGYIVFGINHTYDCAITVFPDGRVIPLNFRWDQSDQLSYLENVIDLWTKDVQFVLDILPAINIQDPNHILTGAIDTTKVGVFGHSMGGGTMMNACRVDSRILAGVSLDGPCFDKYMSDGFSKPFMFMMADGTLLRCSQPIDEKELKKRNFTRQEESLLRKAFKDNNIQMHYKIKMHGSKAYFLVFKDAGHFTFTDAPLIKYMSFLFENVECFGFDVGGIEPIVALRVSSAYLLSFFDTYICGKNEDSLFEPYCFEHPEVQVVN